MARQAPQAYPPQPPIYLDDALPLPYWPDINDNQPSPPPLASPDENPPKWRHITVEEVEDEEAPWIYKKYPKAVATPLGSGVTVFSDILDEQTSMQEQPYAPFKDHKE